MHIISSAALLVYYYGYDRFTSAGGIEGFCSDLSWSLRLDEILVDLLGLGGHLDWVLGLLEVLTGHPELNVLLTELRLQEGTEGMHTICETWMRERQKTAREMQVERERKGGRETGGKRDRKTCRETRGEEGDRQTDRQTDSRGAKIGTMEKREWREQASRNMRT